MAFGENVTITNGGLGVAGRLFAGEVQDAPKWIGIGVGATGADRTAAAADTALSTAVESRVGTNSPTAEDTVQTDDTGRVTQSITATAPRAVDEAGLFDASTAGNLVVSSTFNVVNLGVGDSLQLTLDTQFAAA